MMNKILIVDGDNLLYRAFHKFSNMRNEEGSSSACIFGVPFILNGLITKHKPDRVIIAFDGGRSRARVTILPDYKQRERSDNYEEYKRQKQILIDAMPKFNLSVVHVLGYEADDLIYHITRKLPREAHIVIISSDKDFNQLINKRISIYNPSKNDYITANTCLKITGWEPEEWVDFLILNGDKSDKIPGYRGMGEKRIRDFLTEFGSIRDYLDQPKTFSTIDRKKLKALYELNKELINLKYYYNKYSGDFDEIPVPEPDGFDDNYVRKLFHKYDIVSLQNDTFKSSFKKLI